MQSHHVGTILIISSFPIQNSTAAEILPLTPKSDGDDDGQGHVEHQTPDASPPGQIVDATHFIVTGNISCIVSY